MDQFHVFKLIYTSCFDLISSSYLLLRGIPFSHHSIFFFSKTQYWINWSIIFNIY